MMTASPIVRIIVVSLVGGCRGRAQQPRHFLRAPAMLSPPRQECLSLPNFPSLGIGILGEVDELAEVRGCLLAVACRIGGASGSPVRAEAVGGLFEGGLELCQGSGRLPHLKQQVSKEFAE